MAGPGTVRQRSQEVLRQLPGRVRADVLGEVVPAGGEHPGDLWEVWSHRVARGDQLEGAVGDRQGCAVLVFHDPDPAGAEQSAGARGVGGPRLWAHHRGWEAAHLREALPRAGSYLQR